MNAGWLWALPAAALPLILHLVARRQPPTLPFPAVRYLQQVTREHQRRLKVQHWLLLLVRTLLILTLVLAAAGPTVARDGLASHAPAALVLVLDNSPSSAAVSGGTPILDRLRAPARAVLGKATAEDAVWLLTADGLARRAPAELLAQAVDSLAPAEIRLDLGAALRQAGDLLATEERPAEIVVLSDLQKSALSAADIHQPTLVGMADSPPPPNLGVASMDPGPQPWSPGENRMLVTLLGDQGQSRPLSVQAGARPERPLLAGPAEPVVARVRTPEPGWLPVTVSLDPDEFRMDDHRAGMVRVLPVARARWDPTDRYLAAAAATLAEADRLREGTEVTLGWLGPGSSLVLPPQDLAELGAVNRALERRGSPWRFGGPVVRAQRSDSGPLVGPVGVSRRLRLEYRGGAPRGVGATVDGEPWIVSAGGIVLLGSRIDPSWTALPSSAGFVPLVDAIANRLVRGEQALLAGVPGEPARLPDVVTDVVDGARRWRVEGGASWRPSATGTYFLLSGPDTVGALAVNLDPRESELATATAGEVREAWPGARVLPLERIGEASFAAGARGHLRGPLLWLALLLGLIEVALASRRRGAA